MHHSLSSPNPVTVKKYLVLIVLMVSLCNVYSQHYDLIITAEGDSIGCRIDSVSNNRIYFEMKLKSNWIHTSMESSNDIIYKYKAIDKKSTTFKSGTSYIESRKKVVPRKDAGTIKDVKKNSIYIENLVIFPSVYYGRILPISQRFGLALQVGAYYYAGWAFTGETSLLIGGTKHFFEPGIGFQLDANFHGHIGYRYMGPKGLLIKGGIHIMKNLPVFPSVGLGFSF